MKCLGCDRCEVRLGSWRSSDASLNTKCLGCDRCEVCLGSWRSSDASLRNESSFLALIACERVIPPTRQSQKELQLARLCNQLQPTCASQKWQLASQISSSLTSTKMHINLSEIVWVGGKSERVLISIGHLHWWNVTESLKDYELSEFAWDVQTVKIWKTFWNSWRSWRSGDELTDYTNRFYVGFALLVWACS